MIGKEWSHVLAMICLSDRVTVLSSVSDDGHTERVKWKCLKLEGEYDFEAYGVLAEISQVFAKDRIPVIHFQITERTTSPFRSAI